MTAGATSGNCVVAARWTGSDDYNPSPDVTIANIPMVNSANDAIPVWGATSYASNPTVGGAAVSLGTAPTGAGNGALEYRSGTPDKCTLDSSSGALTGVGAGTCIVQARFVGDSTHGASAWVNSPDIMVEKGTPSPPANAYGSAAQLGVGETREIEVSLEQFGTATYTVASASETYCSVVEDTGAVTGIAAGGDCAIEIAFAQNQNYNSATAQALQTLNVVAGRQNIQHTDPYGERPTVMVGANLAIADAPLSVEGGIISYRVATGSESYCSVDENDGSVEGIAVGDCPIEVQAAGVDPNYAASEWVEIATIAVEEGNLNGVITWNPQNRERWTEELELAAVDVGTTSAVVMYDIDDAGETGCTFAGNSGTAARTLRFTGPGICRVSARATANDYAPWIQEHSVQVEPATITITVGAGFSSGDKLKVGVTTPKTPGNPTTVPADAEISWQLFRGERDCVLVDSRTGSVRARTVAIDQSNPPECSLVVVASKDKYATETSQSVSIELEKGEIGTLSAPEFGVGDAVLSTLLVGTGSASLIAPPVEDHDLPLAVEGFEVNGTDSSDTNKDDVCAVDNDPDSDDFGEVSVGSAAIVGDKCVVTVTVGSVGYNNKAAPAVTLTVGEQMSFDTPPVLVYVGELTIGETSAYLDPDTTGTNLPGTNDDSVSVEWHFRTLNEDICVVEGFGDSNPGRVTLGAQAMSGDTCTVYAIAQATGYGNYSSNLFSTIDIEPGTLSFATAVKPSYAGRTLRIGGRVALVLPPSSIDDNSVPVVWGNWRVVGDDMDGDDATDGDVCTIDEDTGMVYATGSAASEGDTCRVMAVAKASNYNDTDEIEIGTLTIAAALTFGTLTGPTYSGDLNLRGNALPVGTAPSIAPEVTGEEVVWRYRVGKTRRGGVVHTPASDICSVNGNDGTVTPVSSGEIGDECDIVATATAPGYVEEDADPITLTLKEIFSSLTWSSFPGSVAVGESYDLSANVDTPQVNPSADSVTIVVKSGDCSYSASDILSFSGITTCKVTVTANKANYTSIERTFSVTPSLGRLNFATMPVLSYAGALRFGDTSTLLSPTGLPSSDSSSIGVVWHYTFAGFDSSDQAKAAVCERGNGDPEHANYNKVRLGNSAAVGDYCRISVVGRANGYSDYISVIPVTLSVQKGNQNPPSGWSDPYGSNPTLAVGAGPLALDTSSAPSGEGSFEYRIANGDSGFCSVSSDGSVTAKPAGAGEDCVVRARFAGNDNYRSSNWANIATIVIVQGDLSSIISWGPSTLTSDVDASLVLESVVGAQGTDTVTYSRVSGSCAFGSGSDEAERTLSFTDNVPCLVKATVSRTGYVTWDSGNVTIEVTDGSVSVVFGTDGGGFVGSLVIGGDSVAPIIPANYTLGTFSLVSGSEQYCILNDSATGEVEAKAVDFTTSPSCQVSVVISRTGYISATYLMSIGLEKGTITGVSWTPTVLAISDTPLELETVSGALGGDTVTYTHVSGACSFGTGTDRALRTLTFTATGNCVVKATAARTGYTTWDSGNKTILVVDGSVSGVAWNPPRAGTVGVDLILPALTGSQVGDIVSYSRISGDECSFVPTTRTVSFTGSANCVVRASIERGAFASQFDVTIEVAPSGTPALVFTSNPVLAISSSSNDNLRVGGGESERVTFDAFSSNDDGGTTGIVWRFSVQGYESDGITTKANVCQLVSSDSSSANHRKVEQLSGAVVTDICRVSVVGEALGKTNYEGVESVDLPVLGELVFDQSATLPAYEAPYQWELNVRLDGSRREWIGVDILDSRGELKVETLAGNYTDANGVVVTYDSWTAVGKNSVGTAKNNVCSIDPDDGTVTAGSAATENDTCEISANAQAEGFLDQNKVIATLTVRNIQYPPDTNVGTDGTAYGINGAPFAGTPTRGQRYPIVTAPSGGGFKRNQGALKYWSDPRSACTVDTDGRVHVIRAGSCTIWVQRISGANYSASAWVIVWQFTIEVDDGGLQE